ncbi:hypothetical protein QBC40DRAFT_183653 [Triangularia verruculosa]|uniref:Uncharacterized protein n=1 Tax=Triangularia verruculosa TaxID=2587418 RepID=A0AAN6XEH5_9PEZI|nr:hypothetical protein QBC40DRAFT_183653 [Triangularia verruculosa]
MPREVFHWPSIKERLLTPDGRFVFEDHIDPDIAWDVLVEAAKCHHLQDMYDDAWRHLTAARNIRDHGLGGYDGEMQFCFFWLLTAMIKVQLKVHERDGKLPDNLTGNKSPGAMSTLSEGESTDFGESIPT